MERSEPDAGDELLAGAMRDTGIAEHRSLGVLLTGRLTPNDWRTSEPPQPICSRPRRCSKRSAEALRVPDLSFAPGPPALPAPGA